MDKVRAARLASELIGKSINDWQILSFIDSGASAAVFKCRKGSIDAAIKIIDPELEERHGAQNQENRVKLELELIGKDHPNLVNIYDGGRCPNTGLLFIVMEYLPGQNLEKLVGKIPKTEVRQIIAQVAKAALHLETLGLAHRDIKPANIHITDDLQKVTLMDLGILRPIANGQGGTGDEFIGTTRYSPPEFLYSEEEDSTDGWRAVTFYQIGAVLHDLLMERQMFAEVEKPYAKVIDAVKHLQPVIQCADCHPSLVTLAQTCLQKTPTARLRLVRWDDFFSDKILDTDLGALQDEIRKRQISNATSSTAILQPRSAIIRNLDAIGRQFENFIRSVCVDSDLFPAIQINSSNNVEENRRLIRITVPSSKEHSIHNDLYIEIAVSSFDTQLLIHGRASLGGCVEDVSIAWTEIYKGQLDDNELKTATNIFLHKALYAATGVVTPVDGHSILNFG